MKKLFLVAMTALASSPAFASMYVTGSVSGSTTNMAYSGYQSQYTSGSVGFDMASILRLGYTYAQEDSVTEGYTDVRTADALKSSNALPANGNDDPSDDGNLIAYTSRSRVISNSVDLQMILYKGEVVVPFLIGGVIHKQTTMTTTKEGQAPTVLKGVSLGPQAGAGMGFRLNRQFSFKVTYIVSPGEKRKPFEEKATAVWDPKLTFGLTYEL